MMSSRSPFLSRIWARLALLLLLLTALGLLSGAAQAAKEQGKTRYVVKKVGIESFDKVFVRVGELNALVSTAETELNSARVNLNVALGLKKKTALGDALAELTTEAQGKVKVVTTGKMPTLEATDLIPSNVQAGIDGLNSAMNSYALTIEALASIPEETKLLIEESKAFPSQFWKDFGNINIMELSKTFKKAKKIKNNIEVTLSLPGRTTDVVSQVNENTTLIATSFGATWPPSFSGNADSGKGKKDGAKKKKNKKKSKKKE